MAKVRNKKYNPNKAKSSIVPHYYLMPLIAPMDSLADLVKRGYLTNEEVRCNENILPSEYIMLAFAYQHTFVISELSKAKNMPIVKYIKSIRNVIEKFLIKMLHDTTDQDGYTIVPNKVTFGKIGAAKLIWFLENSKKLLYGLTKNEYINAVKKGSANHLIKIQLEPNNPLRYFVDFESSSNFINNLKVI